MKNEILCNVFIPLKEDSWVLIKTNKSTYSLRYGGYRREDGFIVFFDYEELASPFESCMVIEVYSDDYWLFILLENDGVISAGEVDISFSGETRLGVQFEKVADFDNGFFGSEDLFKLTTGESGKSVKQI
jgi:hypothetical protein